MLDQPKKTRPVVIFSVDLDELTKLQESHLILDSSARVFLQDTRDPRCIEFIGKLQQV